MDGTALPELDFTDEVVVVTGAGRGLGRTYALELGRRGARVLINDLGGAVDGVGQDGDVAERTAAEIRAAGGTGVADGHSATDPQEAQKIIDHAIAEWGRVDAVIANAGILHRKPLGELAAAEIETMVKANLAGSIYLAQKSVLAMRKQPGGGRIVLTGSPAALFGIEGVIHYAAAKSGLIGLMMALTHETAKDNIRVNMICPNAYTRMAETFFGADEDRRRAASDSLPPEKVAPLVLYLAHRDCSSNGEILIAGGGWFGRAAVLVGEGARLDGDVTVEAVRDRWQDIRSLRSAQEIRAGSGLDLMGR